jgi:hypothetical protein
MKTDEPTKGLLLFAPCVAAAIALAPAPGAAGPCEEKCQQAYATAPSWEEQDAPVAFSAGPTPDGNGAMAGVGGTF